MISEEQAEQIKEGLLNQIEKNFPENKKEFAKEQVKSMNNEELENFLKQNNLIKKEQEQECVFCSIVSGKIPSYKIDETKNALAVLEINPISKGHILIIPKMHKKDKKSEKELLSFAKKILGTLKTKLDPREIRLSSSILFGHEIINLLPVYGDKIDESKRYSAKKDELEEMRKKLRKKEKKQAFKKPNLKKLKETKFLLPKRIP